MLAGVTIAGTPGTFPDCSSDAQVACRAVTAFPAVELSRLNNGWNLRKGTTVAGLAGGIKNCKNMYNTAIAVDNVTQDIHRTLDNYNNSAGGTLPSNVPTGWSDYQCSGSDWQDISTSADKCTAGGGSGSDVCMMRDNISMQIWTPLLGPQTSDADHAEPDPGNPDVGSWLNAIRRCDNLVYGGYSDWRLPTQFELSSALSHGFSGIGKTNFFARTHLAITKFWSSTSYSGSPNTKAIAFDMLIGKMTDETKTENYFVICTR